MLRDFVKRYQDRPASTEDFANVAGEYFAKSPIGRKYSFRHLGWFFRQWVFQAHLPSYRLEYRIKNQPDGRALLEGTLYQEGVPDNWEMPLPVALHLDKGQVAKGSMLAKGPSIAVSLPAIPTQIILNPDNWVLCDRVSAKRLD
jgi:aminopeptidase N